MQSELHFNRDRSIFSTVRGWLSPTGGTVVDGTRLAVANGLFLVSALVLAFIIALLSRLVDVFVAVPTPNPGLIVLALSILFGIVVWYRFGVAHRRLAQASGRSFHPDRFGIIAGSPFALLALLLLGSGIFGLFISVAGLNFGGFSAAFGRLIFALFFGLLAAASVIVARIAMRT